MKQFTNNTHYIYPNTLKLFHLNMRRLTFVELIEKIPSGFYCTLICTNQTECLFSPYFSIRAYRDS